MQAVEAYSMLSRELAAVAALPPHQLAQLADGPSFSRTIDLAGEPVEIEMDVAWQGSGRAVVRITGNARGASTWHHQRWSESTVVALKDAGRQS